MSETLDYQQTNHTLRIDTPLGADALLLTSVSGEEKLSHCFVYTIEFFTAQPDAAIRDLIGKPVTIWLQNHMDTPEPINGFVRRVTGRPANIRGLTAYRAEVVPRLWFMDCSSDCRIFQNMTYPAIIEQMLNDYGVKSYQIKLFKTSYPVAEYCVQYRESALAFISRLMEQVGLFYFHEHSATDHVLKIVDMNLFTVSAPKQELRVTGPELSGEIATLETDTVFRPGAWALCDYDFQGPTKQMHKQAQTKLNVSMMPQHEHFEFPGGYTAQDVGAWLTELRMEAEEAVHLRLLGTARVARIVTGRRFTLDSQFHGVGEGGATYLITEVRHFAVDNSHLSEIGGAPPEYRNDFVMIPASVQFRPLRLTPKSVVCGAQTATVVSPSAGDPIQVDEYGRVKIFFHWDRRGKPNEGATSCWVRVSQNSAGAGFGGISIPHAGQEVVVDFLEGDPDRPLIIGRVHNADKTASTDLPSDKHKTITRDHGGNKFAMHGKAGVQHVSLITPGALNLFALPAWSQTLSAAASDSSGGGTSWPTIANNPAGPAYQNLQNAASLANSNSGSHPKGSVTQDLNMVTQGDVNLFSNGDTNSWAVGNYNIYVNVNEVSWIQGDLTETVVGNVDSTIKGAFVQNVTGDFAESMANREIAVNGTETLTVKSDTSIALSGGLTHHTAKAVLMIADADKTETVGGDSMTSVAGKTTMMSNSDIAISSTAGAISITSPTKITLTVGGSSVEISPSGIKITGAGPVDVTGPMVNLNC
jgi:type VI secretion system secreted protein VgrG